ncbi:glucuronide transporter [Escherichia coli]|nr:glucuronide transporter [Escherichia coli]
MNKLESLPYPLTDKKFKEIVVEIDNRKKVQQQLISDITN